jgi:hypothetical protein
MPQCVERVERDAVAPAWIVSSMFWRSGAAPLMPSRPRASLSRRAVASTLSTGTPSYGASVSRMKTTAHPASALRSSAVGLGA